MVEKLQKFFSSRCLDEKSLIEMEITRNERSSNLSLSRYKTISRVLVKLDAENSRRWLRVRAKPFLFPRESFSKTLVKM